MISLCSVPSGDLTTGHPALTFFLWLTDASASCLTAPIGR